MKRKYTTPAIDFEDIDSEPMLNEVSLGNGDKLTTGGSSSWDDANAKAVSFWDFFEEEEPFEECFPTVNNHSGTENGLK